MIQCILPPKCHLVQGCSSHVSFRHRMAGHFVSHTRPRTSQPLLQGVPHWMSKAFKQIRGTLHLSTFLMFEVYGFEVYLPVFHVPWFLHVFTFYHVFVSVFFTWKKGLPPPAHRKTESDRSRRSLLANGVSRRQIIAPDM